VTRLALASLCLLAACQGPPGANNQAAPPPEANAVQPANDVARAEQVVRRQLGNPQGLAFSNAARHETDRVPIVCGEFTQGGRRERYIVVDGERAWIESQMRAGEMVRAIREFCGAPGRARGGERG
jgi:hypothetical protein